MKTRLLKKLSTLCLVLLIGGAAWACGGSGGGCGGDKGDKAQPKLMAQCDGEKKACETDCQKSCCKKTESDKKECPAKKGCTRK